MYFKSIELRGFKSFVDETKMVFEPGVTAIIGPNGCGKSNIADALRWVLGEQSAKSMRGSKMEDFIFNGSSARKPTGFAEVSLTFTNISGVISAHPYSEYDEITVTRKLFRTGESEYFINKVPCRLKDIVEVFLDTGINSKSLSIIEQGQVERIVNSKPDDRKVFIDEAAGIMKYKQRRNAAINKLNGSQQNLLRIQDIIGELERQRNSLNRQAKKAERYKVYKSEIRDQGLIYYADQYQEKSVALGELTTAIEQLKEEEARLLAQLSTKRNEQEALNAQISEKERANSELRERKGGIESSIERNENHSRLLAKHIEELKQTSENDMAEIKRIDEDIRNGDDLVAQQIKKQKTAQEQINVTQDEAGKLRIDMEQAHKNLAQTRDEYEQGAATAMKILEDISVRRNARSSMDAKLEMLNSRQTEIAQREQELTDTASELEEQESALGRKNAMLEAKLAVDQKAQADIATQLEAAKQELTEAENDLRSTSELLTASQSRLDSLAELERNFEGYGEGVRELMKLKSKGADALEDARGLLAESIISKPEHETAMTALLGARLEAVMLNNSGSIAEAVKLLKRDNIGRTGFLADDLAPAGVDSLGAPSHPSLIGLASELFTPSDGVAGAYGFLKNSLVAQDIDGALEIWKQTPGAFTVVTLDGEVIDRSGFLFAGSGGSGAEAIVARKRIIAELTVQTQELDRKKESALGARNQLESTLRELEEKLTLAENNLREVERSAYETGRELQAVQADNERATSSVKQFKDETGRIIAERAELNAQLDVANLQIENLGLSKEEIESKNEAVQTRIVEMQTRLDETRNRLQEKELEVSGFRGKLENLNLDIRRLEGIKADQISRSARLKEAVRDSENKREEMSHSIEKLRAENVNMAKDIDDLSKQITSVSEELAEKTETASALNEEIRSLQNELDQVQPKISDMSLNRSETELRIENILEKADTEFNIPIEDLRDTDTSERDMDEVGDRLNFLRQQLGRIGDVNLSALEEYEQVDERFGFLTAQRDDLVSSIATLHKTIENINSTTNRLFKETFEVVSANFEAMFKRLFGGGRAQMKLVYEEGKQEPGVEIMAQPPGKKNQNLNLLSAGEKAMTAIALLFAVFQSKPSPFCLLDEIDAPLDEANIGRFRDMLMEMRDGTQFIVITHSQKTMSFAERLYGVTQEEEGVSKILAVNLDDQRDGHTETETIAVA